MKKIIENYEGQVTFKKTKDPIVLHTFVTDGFDYGYVSYENNDDTFVINWFNKNNVTTESIETLLAVRPRFNCNTIHGEIWKGAYPILFHLLDKGLTIKVKPKLYRKSVEKGDKVSIIDYKFLYDRRYQIQSNDFVITQVNQNSVWITDNNIIPITIELRRNQVKLMKKEDKFTLLDLVCPLCDN